MGRGQNSNGHIIWCIPDITRWVGTVQEEVSEAWGNSIIYSVYCPKQNPESNRSLFIFWCVSTGMSQYDEETKEKGKEDSIDINNETAHVPNDQLPLVNLDGDVAMHETRPSPDLDEDIPVDETRRASNLKIDIPVDETRPSPHQDGDMAMNDTNAGSDLVLSPDKDIDMSEESHNTSKQDLPPNGTPHINPSNSVPNETATSSKEERNSVLRVLRSHSDTTLAKSASSTEEKSNKRNHHVKSTKRFETNTAVNRTSLSPRKTRHVTNSPEKSTSPPKRGRPPKIVVENQVSIRNAAKRTSPIKQAQSPQRKITPRRTVSSPKVQKPTDSRTRQQKQLLGRRSSPARPKTTRKSTGSNIVKNTRNSITKNKQSSVSPDTKAHKVVSGRKSKGGTGDDNQSSARKASPLSEKNPMDKYINLDFLLHANQHMSELVTDSNREEGTLDTASEAERRRVVALAKLYGLRVRMVGKEGELPVALIKGRESSLPKPGQVDKLLYSMTRAMVIKRQAAESRDWTKKHKLSGGRRNAGGPAKKKRV